MHILRREIKRLMAEWTGTLVEYHDSYDDFDHFNSYGCRLELWLSLAWAVQMRHTLQTIWTTGWNDQYIRVSETSTWRLDQTLRAIEASMFLFFSFLRNIFLNNMEKQLSWRKNKATIKTVWGWSSSMVFILATHFLTPENWWYLWNARCCNVILPSCIDSWLLWKHWLALNQAAPLPCVQKSKIVVWRWEFIVLVILWLLVILPKDNTCYSER